MAKIRITKIFRYESAHVLSGYDGPCKNIHGHSNVLHVTIIGEPLIDQKHPKNGMVLDFGNLKEIVNRLIVKPYDHALVLNSNAQFKNIAELTDKIIWLDFQPTCELLVTHFAELIKKELPQNIELVNVKLFETSTSFAEWVREDNK